MNKNKLRQLFCANSDNKVVVICDSLSRKGRLSGEKSVFRENYEQKELFRLRKKDVSNLDFRARREKGKRGDLLKVTKMSIVEKY